MSDSAAGDAYQFEFVSIDGDKLPLAEWRGRPVLVVNTASFCGYTPQYRDLEALWRRYQPRGLVVLGVPSNDFGEQEPGTEAEIKQFCESSYQVDFPLTEKYRVVGAAADPQPIAVIEQQVRDDGQAERSDDAEHRIGGCRAEARQEPGHLTMKDRTPDAQDADRAGGNGDNDADQHALQQ